MAKLTIHGGIPLNGEITPTPNKNTILKLIPASILTDDTVIIKNVPKTSDVLVLLEIYSKLGGTTNWLDRSTIELNASGINSYIIDPELSDKVKSSVMFLAPLLVKFGKAHMPQPSGCKLGTRPLDAFVENMVQMGATWKKDEGYFFELDYDKFNQSHNFTSWFASVTGTENLILLASMCEYETRIYNCACEPHTQELCEFLVKMGVAISGIGSNLLVIKGSKKLSGVEWIVRSDHIDIGGLIAAAAITNGDILINHAEVRHMEVICQAYEKLGVHTIRNYEKNTIHVKSNQQLKIQKTVRGHILDIKAGPWPMIPPDLIHELVATALCADGSCIFHNSFYEFGFFFVEQITEMKGSVIMADPHRIITFGKSKLEGTQITAPNIIQAAYSLVLLGLNADGVTVLDKADSLNRRYPDLVENFQKLGAKISITN